MPRPCAARAQVRTGGRLIGGDVEQVAAPLQEHTPDGVLSMHDSDLVWTAHLAELLELPFHSVDTALKLTDKHAQREALAAAGLSVPRFRIIAGDADAAAVTEIATGFTYPAVLKPRNGQASRDTLPISSPLELDATLDQLRGEPDWRVEDFVLEGFVPDASTDSVEPASRTLSRSRASSRTAMSSTRRSAPARRSCGRSARPATPRPTALSDELADQVFTVAGDAAHALGVTIGCLHTEIKLTDDGPVVIEVNGRPGGGMSEMLERASGFSILRTAFASRSAILSGSGPGCLCPDRLPALRLPRDRHRADRQCRGPADLRRDRRCRRDRARQRPRPTNRLARGIRGPCLPLHRHDQRPRRAPGLIGHGELVEIAGQNGGEPADSDDRGRAESPARSRDLVRSEP